MSSLKTKHAAVFLDDAQLIISYNERKRTFTFLSPKKRKIITFKTQIEGLRNLVTVMAEEKISITLFWKYSQIIVDPGYDIPYHTPGSRRSLDEEWDLYNEAADQLEMNRKIAQTMYLRDMVKKIPGIVTLRFEGQPPAVRIVFKKPSLVVLGNHQNYSIPNYATSLIETRSMAMFEICQLACDHTIQKKDMEPLFVQLDNIEDLPL